MVHSLTLASPSGRIYDQVSKTKISLLPLQVESYSATGTRPAIVCVAAGRDLEMAVVDGKGGVYVCDVEQNRYRRVASGCGMAQGVVWVPVEGGALAIAVGKETKVYQVNGQLVATLRGHKEKIEGMDVNPLRKWIITQSVETVVVWEIGTWKRLRTINTEASKYSLCRFTPDCQSLIINLRDGSLYQLSLAKFTPEKHYQGSGEVRLFCCKMEEMYGITESEIVIWDVKQPQGPKATLAIPQAISRISQCLLCENSKMILLADNGICYLIDLAAAKLIGELRGHNCEISSISLSPKGLIYKGNDGLARIIDLSLHIHSLVNTPQDHLPLTLSTLSVPPSIPQQADSVSSDTSVVVIRKEGLDFNNVSSVASTSEPDQPCQHHLFRDLFKKAGINPEESRLQHCKLNQMLQHFGEYPAQYRVMIWRFLLQLPNNKSAFEGLYSKGMHPALTTLHVSASRVPPQIYAKLERVISAMAYWSPIFGEAEFLPELLVPLAYICRGDDLSFFEAAVSLFLHWLQHWLEFYPTPPLNYLQSIDNLVKFHSPKLHAHLQRLHCQPKAYIWPGLKHFYLEMIGVEGVAKMLDFLFTDWDKPQLFLFISAAIILKNKNRLMKMQKSADICAFFVTPRAVKLPKIIEIAFTLFNETPSDVPIVGFTNKLPIPPGQYPLFTGYPKFIVEERQGIREKILADEEAAVSKPVTAADISNHLSDYTEKERLHQLKHDQMTQLAREWRDLAQMEEQLRAQERLAFDRQFSAQKQKDIQDMEKRFTENMQRTAEERRQELQQMEKEMTRGEMSDQYALETKIADEALRAIEQRAVQTISESISQRTQEELKRREALITAAYQTQMQLKDTVTQKTWEKEDEANRLRTLLLKEREAQAEERKRLEETAENIENAQRMKTLEHELKLLEVAEERRLREVAEEELERGKSVALLQGQKRTLLSSEANHHFSELKRRENFHETKLLEERQNIIQSVSLSHRKELQAQQDELERLDREKERKEAEGKLIELRKQSEQKALEGERQFQEEVLQIDSEAKQKRQENLAKLFAKKEEEEQLYFQRVLQSERSGQERKEHFERQTHADLLRKLEEQRAKTLKAQQELAQAHKERIEQETALSRRIPAEAELTRKQTSQRSSLSSGQKERRAVTFYSNYTSPEEGKERSECSCSCESGSGTSTPPMPTRSIHEDDYSSELSEGSELVLSGSSFTSSYSQSRH